MEPLLILRPDTRKSFLFNVFKIVGAVALIIGIVFYINYVVDMSIFFDALKIIGININIAQKALLIQFIIAVIVITGLLLTLNYLSLNKERYVFYEDKLVYYKNFLLIMIHKTEIPYQNIIRVNFDNDIFDAHVEGGMLAKGTINIELTGMEEKNIKLEFIDDTKTAVKNIQTLLTKYKTKAYARYIEKNKINNIVDRY